MRTIVGVLAAVLVTAACSSPLPAASTGRSGEPSIDRSAPPLAAASSITDPHGRKISLPKPPERIVCLSGLCDDMVVELGMTPVGTSSPALISHPALLGQGGSAVPVVQGSFGSEDVESIARLRPDLVVGLSGVHEPLATAIEKFAPLWLTEPKNWQESVGYLRGLGALTGRVEQAVRAEREFRGKLADAVARTRQTGQARRTVVLMYGSVDSIGVDTADSLKGDLLKQLFSYPFPAKGSDVSTASNYSVEELLARKPDVVFVYSLLFSDKDRTLSAQLADNPVWRQVPAVTGNRVHEMHAKLWGSGRGTRSLSAVIDQALEKVPSA